MNKTLQSGAQTFTSTRKTREASVLKARARGSAPIKTGFQKETNMAAYMSTKHVCGKIRPKVTFLDFSNSNLISIGSLTYSLTLGCIHGIKIHGCRIAEVVKIKIRHMSWVR